jgi:microcystin-dependent protein
VLGQITVSGRAGDLYTTTAADTTLQPFNVQMNGPAPTITNAVTGGNLPVPLRNPYLGLTFIIALNGIFPSRG